jgi:hypothetical protein
VPEVRRISKFAVVAIAGAAIGAVVARFRRAEETPEAPPDERTEELRRKLAEARAAAADQDDFEAAGMGAETIVEEPPRPEPAEPETPPAEAEAPPAEAAAETEPAPTPAEVEPAQPEPPAAEAEPTPPADAAPPPQDEFEAMRRRIHEEGKKAAEDMRRSADPPKES